MLIPNDQEPPVAVDGVVTILELATEKMNMHARHENDLNKMLSQLSTESSKQTSVSNLDVVSTSGGNSTYSS